MLRELGEPCAGGEPFLYAHATAAFSIADAAGKVVLAGRAARGRGDRGVQPRSGRASACRRSARSACTPSWRRGQVHAAAGRERAAAVHVQGRARRWWCSIETLAVWLLLVVARGLRRRALPHDGGRDTLPGPLPAGVTFAPAATTAAGAAVRAAPARRHAASRASTLWKDRPVVLFFFASWCSPLHDPAGPPRARWSSDYGDVVDVRRRRRPGQARRGDAPGSTTTTSPTRSGSTPTWPSGAATPSARRRRSSSSRRAASSCAAGPAASTPTRSRTSWVVWCAAET